MHTEFREFEAARGGHAWNLHTKFQGSTCDIAHKYWPSTDEIYTICTCSKKYKFKYSAFINISYRFNKIYLKVYTAFLFRFCIYFLLFLKWNAFWQTSTCVRFTWSNGKTSVGFKYSNVSISPECIMLKDCECTYCARNKDI